MESAVPVIDLLDFPRQSGKLIKACEEWGCFRLLNYEGFLGASLMAEMKEVLRSLLDLSTEIKNRRKDDVLLGSGYMPPNHINPLLEGFSVYDMFSVQDIDAFCTHFDASPHQRETIKKYAAAVHGIMMDIVHKMGEGLGVAKVSMEEWPCQFRFNKYNFIPEAVGSYGVQTHTDPDFLTVLQDDEYIGGLEVMKKSGEFFPIDPWPNTLLLNLGDIATAWSNGRFHTVKHRVMCKEAKTRFSIGSFLLGPKDSLLEPPPEIVDAEHPRLYVPFTYNDYKKLRSSTKLQTGEVLNLMLTNI